MGYYTVKLKPEILPSIQNAEAFTSNEVLFDWIAVEIPKGSGKLVNATLMIKPKGDGGPTDNNFGLSLLFSSSDSVSLGTPGVAVDRRPSKDFLGLIEFLPASFGPTGMRSTTVASTSHSSVGAHTPLVLTPSTSEQATNVGYNKMYMGAIATGDFDFTSINAIAEAGAAGAASTQVITMDGGGMDVREHFGAGDVVAIGTSVGASDADSPIGTIASADSATQITLTTTSATALVDGDILYDVSPITIVLGFED